MTTAIAPKESAEFVAWAGRQFTFASQLFWERQNEMTPWAESERHIDELEVVYGMWNDPATPKARA